jgi:hypothetical protein
MILAPLRSKLGYSSSKSLMGESGPPTQQMETLTQKGQTLAEEGEGPRSLKSSSSSVPSTVKPHLPTGRLTRAQSLTLLTHWV